MNESITKLGLRLDTQILNPIHLCCKGSGTGMVLIAFADDMLGQFFKISDSYKLLYLFQMQSILHHNQSGDAAFTGNLKTREVHRAITLHPIKQPSFMYRLHNYFKVNKK